MPLFTALKLIKKFFFHSFENTHTQKEGEGEREGTKTILIEIQDNKNEYIYGAICDKNNF